MTIFKIQYRDGAGAISDRLISEVERHGEDSFTAYCHLRQEKRTFTTGKVLSVTDMATGQTLENSARALGLIKGGGQTIESLVDDILPAIKALKFFAKSLRDFAVRERSHILNFIRSNSRVDPYSESDLDLWLQKLWCGNVFEYINGEQVEYGNLLREIPEEQLPICRDVAYKIVYGSGRKAIANETLARLKRDFAGHGT